MWATILAFLVKLIEAVVTGWQGERARDKANQESGVLAAENEILDAAAERAKHAKQVRENVAGMSDDDLYK